MFNGDDHRNQPEPLLQKSLTLTTCADEVKHPFKAKNERSLHDFPDPNSEYANVVPPEIAMESRLKQLSAAAIQMSTAATARK